MLIQRVEHATQGGESVGRHMDVLIESTLKVSLSISL